MRPAIVAPGIAMASDDATRELLHPAAAETIRLREHRRETVELADADAIALRDQLEGRVTMTRGASAGLWNLSPGSWAGAATLPSGRRVVVEPKVKIGALFAMIEEAYAGIRDPFREQKFDYDTVDGLFEFMVRLFIDRAEAIATRGILRGYTTIASDAPAIRGRLLVAESLRRRPVVRDGHWCEYGRLTADVPENRILLWAATVLASGEYRDTSHVPRLRRIIAAMRDVMLDADAELLIESLGYHRLNDHYRPAVAIAQLLLKHLAYSGRVGSATFLAFLVDMNALFEKYVGAALRRALAHCGITVTEQRKQSLDNERTVELRPDVTLLRDGQPFMVLDAKYKLARDRADVYQMVAYCHGLELHNAVLIYPEGEEVDARTLTIRGAGDIRVHYLPISLNGTPAELRHDAERIAGELMRLSGM